MPQYDGLLALDRMERAVWKVRDRLLRAVNALEKAGIAYAVVGGNAVMAWVEQVDESAVRATQDVDLLVRPDDYEQVKAALAAAGFIHRHTAGSAGLEMFLDGEDAKARDAVHVLFAGQHVRPDDLAPVPDVSQSTAFRGFRVIDLKSLVRMKLTSFRRKDQMHLLDMMNVGLIDAAWLNRLSPELAARLKELLDNPEG
ncbi:MAG: nucleotidyltransferase family protein [Phycisphaeraceae bacterium]